MNFLDDRKIKKIAKDENIKAPNKIIRCLYIYLAIENLTDKNEKTNFNLAWRYSLRFAIALILLTFIVLPNISPKISYAMQELPIIGNIVKVITIRNYFDKEGNSELNADIPSIKDADNTISESNDLIN